MASLPASFRKAAQFFMTKFVHHHKQINTGSQQILSGITSDIINKICTLLTIYFTKYNRYEKFTQTRSNQLIPVSIE